MDKNTDAANEEYLSKIAELPPKWQRAFAWLINNFEFAIKICEASNLSGAENDYLRQKAIENDDAILEILLILNEVLKRENMDLWE